MAFTKTLLRMERNATLANPMLKRLAQTRLKNHKSAQRNQWSLALLITVTEQIDHHRRARTTDYRLDSAWFGKGAEIKEKAFIEAIKLIA